MLKDTIISAFNYDGTLLKWLKKVEDALQNASATEFRVNKKGNATISFSIVFANGDTLESGDIILQQGESVTNATIRQGHLILTLSNGDELDAGDLGAVTDFSINASQHLIVTYQNGTTQDLGAIFSGNVNINGNFTANSIIENMSGYSFNKVTTYWNAIYCGVVKNGNKITFVVFGSFTFDSSDTHSTITLGEFRGIPSDVFNKLYPYPVGVVSSMLAGQKVQLFYDYNQAVEKYCDIQKVSNYIQFALRDMQIGLTNGTTYYFRIEQTFLLSDNLAG